MIRPLVTKDSERLRVIIKEALGYDIPAETIKERLAVMLAREEYRLLAAEEEGVAVGYIQAGNYESLYLGSMKNILALAVDPAYQGRGLGRQLLSAVEDWAKEDGCAGIRLNSGFERTGAHEFYRRCGYTVRKGQKQFVKYFE